MCGISCIVTLRGTQPSAREGLAKELDASLAKIKHRGPDSNGSWISSDQRVALGHVRLSINDLGDDGRQPLHSTDGSVHAVVNGELYDYDRLRAEMEDVIQYKFQGRSDSELVLALYQYYGLSFLSHLRGEFSICLYDEQRKLFVAARDRYGIKPLFWTVSQGRLLVAAEQKAFIPLGWKPEWDVPSIVESGWSNDQRTLFKDVRKVRPGHYLLCRSLENLEMTPFWDIEYPNKSVVDPRTEAEMIEGVRTRLVEAVRQRLRADVPVGVYLSGGIDSSVVAGIVAHLLKEEGEKLGSAPAKERMACFTISFDEDSGFDETTTARDTATWLDVDLHTKHMSEAELAKYFVDAVYHIEHHWGELNFVAKFALSELTRNHGVKVVLTGEGADEVFAGYRMYVPDYLREPDPSWPPALQALPETTRTALHEKQESIYTKFLSTFGSDSTNRRDNVALRQTNASMVGSMASIFKFGLWAPWTQKLGLLDPRECIAANIDGRVRDLMGSVWHPLHSALYLWARGHLANIVLSCLGDRAEMGHSVEGRTPFLDHPLTQYVNALPPSMKVKYLPPASLPTELQGPGQEDGDFVEKYILREAAKPFVTEKLYRMKKHQFSAPRTYPAHGPLHQLFSRLVTRESVEALGFVDWERSKGLLSAAFVDQDQLAFRQVVMLAEWVVISQKFGVRAAHEENC